MGSCNSGGRSLDDAMALRRHPRRLRRALAALHPAAADDNPDGNEPPPPPLEAALGQAEGQAFLLEGHPESPYNGLYARAGETPNGFPKFINPSGIHLYRYQDYEQWFLWRVSSALLPRLLTGCWLLGAGRWRTA